MADDELKEQGIAGSGQPDKKILMTAGIVVVLLIIAVIAVVFTQMQSGKGTTQPVVIKNFTQPGTGSSSAQTQKVRQTGTQTITQTPTKIPIDFNLQSGNPSSCGLTCRQLDATITNAGYATAHNVCIEVNMHNSRNEIINLNGNPSLNRCVGDIAGDQTKTESITINADCGMFATKCIGETLTLQTRVTSVEKTVQFPDQLIAA